MLCIFSPPPCFHLLFFDWTMHPFTSSAAFSRILFCSFQSFSVNILGKRICAQPKPKQQRKGKKLLFVFFLLSSQLIKRRKKANFFYPSFFQSLQKCLLFHPVNCFALITGAKAVLSWLRAVKPVAKATPGGVAGIHKRRNHREESCMFSRHLIIGHYCPVTATFTARR